MLDYLFTKTMLSFFTQSLWRDEAFSYFLAKKNILDVVILSAHDFTPPLYYLLLHFWIKVFGRSEIVLRLPSLLFFCVTIYMCFLYMRHILKIREGKSLIYSLLFILNPLLVYYAFEARMYTMMSFLAVASFYFFVKKNYKLYFWVTLAGIFTHYFLVFVPLAQALYLWFFEKHAKETKKYLRLIRNMFIVFVPWLLYVFLANVGATQEFWITKKPMLSKLPAFLYVGFDENIGYLKQVLRPLSAVLGGILVYGLIRLKRFDHEEKKLFYLLLFWVTIPTFTIFFISFYKPLFLGRYLIFATVGFLVLLVYVIEKFPKYLTVIAFILLLMFAQNVNKLQIKERKKGSSKRVFTEIKKLASPQDVLYVTSVLNFHEAQYYFDENRVFIYNKTYQEIPSYVGKVLIPKSSLKTTLPIFPKKAFVIESNLSYQILSMY